VFSDWMERIYARQDACCCGEWGSRGKLPKRGKASTTEQLETENGVTERRWSGGMGLRRNGAGVSHAEPLLAGGWKTMDLWPGEWGVGTRTPTAMRPAHGHARVGVSHPVRGGGGPPWHLVDS